MPTPLVISSRNRSRPYRRHNRAGRCAVWAFLRWLVISRLTGKPGLAWRSSAIGGIWGDQYEVQVIIFHGAVWRKLSTLACARGTEKTSLGALNGEILPPRKNSTRPYNEGTKYSALYRFDAGSAPCVVWL